MKSVVEHFGKKKCFFRSLMPVDLRKLGTRKRVLYYLGVDMQGYYTAILVVHKKSRILRKEAETFLELHHRLEEEMQSKIKKKYLLLEAPICSKAKLFLEESGWCVEVL